MTIVAANIIVVSPAQLATGRLSFLLEQVVARVSVLGHVDAVRQQVQRCRFRRLPRMMPQTFLALCLDGSETRLFTLTNCCLPISI